jgi:hypothetical protein
MEEGEKSSGALHFAVDEFFGRSCALEVGFEE